MHVSIYTYMCICIYTYIYIYKTGELANYCVFR